MSTAGNYIREGANGVCCSAVIGLSGLHLCCGVWNGTSGKSPWNLIFPSLISIYVVLRNILRQQLLKANGLWASQGSAKYTSSGLRHGNSDGLFRDVNTRRHWENDWFVCEDEGIPTCRLTFFHFRCDSKLYNHWLIATCIEIERKQKQWPWLR